MLDSDYSHTHSTAPLTEGVSPEVGLDPINKLFEKLIFGIFSKLNPLDLASCRQVSKKWREFAMHESFSPKPILTYESNSQSVSVDMKILYRDLQEKYSLHLS